LTPNAYLASIIKSYRLPTGINLSPPLAAKALCVALRQWAGQFLIRIRPSGSFAKGTAIRGCSDLDLFVSLKPQTPDSLEDLYHKLGAYLTQVGYQVRPQNVSVHVVCGGLQIDVTPAKKQPGITSDHSLYVSKTKTWTKTNVYKHIRIIASSTRRPEIVLAKVWRQCHNLDFPSFYLELSVIRALAGKPSGQLAQNLAHFLNYLVNEFVDAIIVDPSNTANAVSDMLTAQEKQIIASAVRASLAARTWGEIIW